MYSLLLVDDETIVRMGVKNCLDWKALKIEHIYEASNGMEALEILQAHHIDIMITDLKMAAMDGLTLLKRLAEWKQRPEVLVMSCYNDFENMREAMKCGVRDFLFKPSLQPKDIFESLQQVIDYIERSLLDGTNQSSLHKGNYLEEFQKLTARLENVPMEQAEMHRLVFGYIHQLFILDDDDQSDLHRFASLLFSHANQIRQYASSTEITHLLHKLMQRAGETPDDPMHSSIALALEIIQNNLSDPNLSLSFVADQIGLSPSYFSRLFKSVTLKNYSDYIIEKRIALANRLRETTDLKAKEIASRVGYTNTRYFSKLYKHYTGYSIGQHKT